MDPADIDKMGAPVRNFVDHNKINRRLPPVAGVVAQNLTIIKGHQKHHGLMGQDLQPGTTLRDTNTKTLYSGQAFTGRQGNARWHLVCILIRQNLNTSPGMAAFHQ